MRLLEGLLAKRWRERLLDRLLPHAETFPALSRALKEKNPDKSTHDIFGKTRWATLAKHGRHLDQICNICPDGFIPWDTSKVARLFDNLRDQKEHNSVNIRASKPMEYFKTVAFFSQILGTDGKLDYPYLRNKRDSIRAALIEDEECEDHRAPAPPVEAAMALERASRDAPTWLDRWFASACRHGYGASGRYGDYQHT